MRSWLLIVVVGVLSAGDPPVEAPPAVKATLADLAVRYVNDDVVTLGDIGERAVQRLRTLRTRQQPEPRTREEQVRFYRETLEEITDDLLFVQYADSLKIALDPNRIADLVYEQARSNGRSLTQAALARERKRFERSEKIRAVMRFFDDRTGQISPSDLWAYYQEHAAKFRRPARSRLYQILVRAADAEDRKALLRAKKELFKSAQDAADAPIAELIKARTDAILDKSGDQAGQEQLIDGALAALAQVPVAGLSVRGRDLVRDATDLTTRSKAMKSPEQVIAELTALRETLVGKGVEAFAAAARKVSQGPRANEGGERGWIESGEFNAAIDAELAKVKSGELSPVLRVDHVIYLFLVVEQSEAAQRSFAEVSGEIDNTLRATRSEAIRAQAARVLRQKGSVRDLMNLEQVLVP